LAPAPARAAFRIAPNDPETISTYVRAIAASAAQLDPKAMDALRKAVTVLQKTDPQQAETTRPAYVGLLTRVDKAEAEKLLREVLASTKPASEDVLLRLALVAQDAGSPLSGDLLGLCESAHGV